jgi:hypothetical protein
MTSFNAPQRICFMPLVALPTVDGWKRRAPLRRLALMYDRLCGLDVTMVRKVRQVRRPLPAGLLADLDRLESEGVLVTEENALKPIIDLPLGAEAASGLSALYVLALGQSADGKELPPRAPETGIAYESAYKRSGAWICIKPERHYADRCFRCARVG